MKNYIIIFFIICCSISFSLSISGILFLSSGNENQEPKNETQSQETSQQQVQVQVQDAKPTFEIPIIKGRYVQLRRIDGKNEAINILEIEVYNKNNKITEGVSASLYPQYGDPNFFGPQYLIDGLAPTKFSSSNWKLPHTTDTKDAFMELDLGSEQAIDRIVIKNRLDCCKDRIVGTEVVILDSNAKVKYSKTIEETKDVYQFFVE